MRRPFGLVLALTSVLALGACTAISYHPALSLGPSPVKIPAKLQVETFVDRSPAEDKTIRIEGKSATEPEFLIENLEAEVTNAVIADFQANGVFAEASKITKNPDVVMTGEIKRFHGQAALNSVGWITLVAYFPSWFLGVPIQSSEGEVDLTITIHRPDGTVLGTYNGWSERSDWHTVYTQPINGVGITLNKAFNQAMQQIRDQIIANADKFL